MIKQENINWYNTTSKEGTVSMKKAKLLVFIIALLISYSLDMVWDYYFVVADLNNQFNPTYTAQLIFSSPSLVTLGLFVWISIAIIVYVKNLKITSVVILIFFIVFQIRSIIAISQHGGDSIYPFTSELPFLYLAIILHGIKLFLIAFLVGGTIDYIDYKLKKAVS